MLKNLKVCDGWNVLKFQFKTFMKEIFLKEVETLNFQDKNGFGCMKLRFKKCPILISIFYEINYWLHSIYFTKSFRIAHCQFLFIEFVNSKRCANTQSVRLYRQKIAPQPEQFKNHEFLVLKWKVKDAPRGLWRKPEKGF